jgi:hypothetical protein
MRARAGHLVTLELGPRSDLEIRHPGMNAWSTCDRRPMAHAGDPLKWP